MFEPIERKEAEMYANILLDNQQKESDLLINFADAVEKSMSENTVSAKAQRNIRDMANKKVIYALEDRKNALEFCRYSEAISPVRYYADFSEVTSVVQLMNGIIRIRLDTFLDAKLNVSGGAIFYTNLFKSIISDEIIESINHEEKYRIVFEYCYKKGYSKRVIRDNDNTEHKEVQDGIVEVLFDDDGPDKIENEFVTRFDCDENYTNIYIFPARLRDWELFKKMNGFLD